MPAANQLVILGDASATPQARAEALRFIIHFVGDVHQPAHDTTNSDRGGNCVPVAFFDHAPKETNPTCETYNPNLNENLAADYQNAAAPVVREQLAKAGIRLAALLNSIWP